MIVVTGSYERCLSDQVACLTQADERCGDVLDVVQQGAVAFELVALLGTSETVGVGCHGAATAGAVVGFDDSAIGEPAAAVVIAPARVLALFPGHLLCATELVIPA